MTPVKVLALDLERTLISDALNREPRPGLYEFLDFCTNHFERIALFTAVSQPLALEIVNELYTQGLVPPSFMNKMEYVEWDGPYKDLALVRNTSPLEVILIDDKANGFL